MFYGRSSMTQSCADAHLVGRCCHLLETCHMVHPATKESNKRELLSAGSSTKVEAFKGNNTQEQVFVCTICNIAISHVDVVLVIGLPSDVY